MCGVPSCKQTHSKRPSQLWIQPGHLSKTTRKIDVSGLVPKFRVVREVEVVRPRQRAGNVVGGVEQAIRHEVSEQWDPILRSVDGGRQVAGLLRSSRSPTMSRALTQRLKGNRPRLSNRRTREEGDLRGRDHLRLGDDERGIRPPLRLLAVPPHSQVTFEAIRDIEERGR